MKGNSKRFLIKPVVTAKMLQAAEVKDTDNVLVVGCASGYAAALVAKLAARVTATECEPSLAAKAKDVLGALGLGNVTVRVAAAAEGDSADAPYDVIVLNGATEIAPEGLYRQLRDGGRLVGVFAMTKPQRATIVTRSITILGTGYFLMPLFRFCLGLSDLRLSFSSLWTVKSCSGIKVWPGCPTLRVSYCVAPPGGSLPVARGIRYSGCWCG